MKIYLMWIRHGLPYPDGSERLLHEKCLVTFSKTWVWTLQRVRVRVRVNLIIHSNVCLLYKIIYNASAPPLKKFVTLCSENTARVTRSVTKGECSIPKHKTQFVSSSFSCAAMSQWNALPTEFILCINPHTFSCLSKRWLLSKQACTHCGVLWVCVCMCMVINRYVSVVIREWWGLGMVGLLSMYVLVWKSNRDCN